MGSQTESFAIPPCGRGTTVGRVFLRCPDSKESCGAVPSPPVGSGRAIPTQHIHASVLQALVLLSLLPRLEFLCSCRDRICLVGPSRDSPSMFFFIAIATEEMFDQKGVVSARDCVDSCSCCDWPVCLALPEGNYQTVQREGLAGAYPSATLLL